MRVVAGDDALRDEHHEVRVVIAISGDEQQLLGVFEVFVEDVGDVLRRELHRSEYIPTYNRPHAPALAAVAVSRASAAALAAQSGPHDARARDIYKQLVEINTTDSVGSIDEGGRSDGGAAEGGRLSRRRRSGARARPAQAATWSRAAAAPARSKPLLLLAHLDVVEAKREDWSIDPFTLLEKDGYFYGRGTSDDKAMASILIANLIRLKQEGFSPIAI